MFLQDEFFDPRDLVQVNYEMLRRVRTEGQSVTDAASSFGFSRSSFYQAQSAFEQDGLAGLVPHKRGPEQAHKLTEEVLAFIGEPRQKEPSIRLPELVNRIEERFRHQGSSTKHRAQSAAPSKKTTLNGAVNTSATRHWLPITSNRVATPRAGRAAEAWISRFSCAVA